MIPDQIHWAAYDGATGELVSWGSASTLESVANQITVTRRHHGGWVTIQQLDEPLEQTRSDLPPAGPLAEAARVNRVRHALTELEQATRSALDCEVDRGELAAAAHGPLVGVRNLLWPDAPAADLPTDSTKEPQ